MSGLLEINALCSGYKQSQVIHDLELKIQPKEIVAIMGRKNTKGEIKLDGKNLEKLDPYQRVENGVAYVPQGRMIFSTMSVLENIQTGLPASAHGKVPDDLYELFPVLWDMRKRKGGNLSGGQQQQLAIARALATNPKVLLLDEPTEGIQPSIIKDIARTLKEIRDQRDLTIVVSEQVLSFTMAMADRFLVIDKGRFAYENVRENVDETTISKYLSV